MIQVIVTTHANQRILERIGDKKKALKKLRRAQPMYRREDGATVMKNGELRFVVRKTEEAWVLITVWNVLE